MNKMMKKLSIAGVVIAATVITSMTAFANSEDGIALDPGASVRPDEKMVYCVEDVEVKDYIHDYDNVLVTYPKGTIFKCEGDLVKDGKDQGWGMTIAKNGPEGGKCDGFFDMSKVKTYDGKDDIVTKLEGNNLTIGIPLFYDEYLEVEVSDKNVLQLEHEGMEDGVYMMTYSIPDGNYHNSTVTFSVMEYGNKKNEYQVTYYGYADGGYTTVYMKPLSKEEIEENLDYYSTMYLADGSTVQIARLKNGRLVDSEGYDCIGFADTACKLHDGTVVYGADPTDPENFK